MSECANNPFSGPAERIALALIGFYQRRISPYKGFRCAHAVLHGGPGCSGFAKSAIREHGLWRAVSLVRQRFRDCRVAMETLMAAQADKPEEPIPVKGTPRPKKKKKSEWCSRNDCAMAGCEAPATCCGSIGSKGTAAGGAAAGAGAEAATGVCGGIAGGVGEGIAGACGGIAGGISCCG